MFFSAKKTLCTSTHVSPLTKDLVNHAAVLLVLTTAKPDHYELTELESWTFSPIGCSEKTPDLNGETISGG